MQTKSRFRVLPVALTIIILATTAWAGNGKILYRFPYGPDGAGPVAPLVMDAAGNLYGTTPYGGRYGAGNVFELSPSGAGGWTKSVLYSFTGGLDGSGPQAGLILDSNGNLYGTTACGGRGAGNIYVCMVGEGLVFKLTPQGGGIWTETVLYNFSGGADGGHPTAGLIFDSTGNLYGTTSAGGDINGACSTVGCGVVFELTSGVNGVWQETVIHTFAFDWNGIEGASPTAAVVFDKTGNLYGTTSYGPLQNGGGGIVYQLAPNNDGTWTENVLCNLPQGVNGFQPGVTVDDAGNLYGVTTSGGTAQLGFVFELSHDGNGIWTQTTLYNFTGGSDGEYPDSSLILDPTGNLYGTTFLGGGGPCATFGCGTIFQLSLTLGSWTENVLYRFRGNPDGCCLQAGLVRDKNGTLYGTASGGGSSDFGTVFELSPVRGGKWAGALLHSFHSMMHGRYANGDLVADSEGNLFGTTLSGGTYDRGTVFKLDASGKQTVLYSFAGGNDGMFPYGRLVFDLAGNLYGTTSEGGSTTACSGSGCGTAYELSPLAGGGWKETLIHAFPDQDGRYPFAGLVFDNKGNLYGTASWGGSNGGGTVFQLVPEHGGTWSENVLYSFDDGYCTGSPQNPNGRLVFDTVGNLYGTVSGGSAYPRGCTGGAVFKLMPSLTDGPWNISYVYGFCAFDICPDGSGPAAGLVIDVAGNIYGSTVAGGDLSCGGVGCGVVFEIDTKGRETVLHAFHGGEDGAVPSSDLALDVQGSLYGTTRRGGGKGACYSPGFGCGTVFKVTPLAGGTWDEHILHRFSGPDGGNPSSGVLLDPPGHRLFGTTPYGGIGGANNLGIGVVYEIDR